MSIQRLGSLKCWQGLQITRNRAADPLPWNWKATQECKAAAA